MKIRGMGTGYSQRELGLSKERETGMVFKEVGIELGFFRKRGNLLCYQQRDEGYYEPRDKVEIKAAPGMRKNRIQSFDRGKRKYIFSF